MKKGIKITKEKICENHKRVQLGYNEWHQYAKENHEHGIEQKMCPVCGYWLFPEEFNTETPKNNCTCIDSFGDDANCPSCYPVYQI